MNFIFPEGTLEVAVLLCVFKLVKKKNVITRTPLVSTSIHVEKYDKILAIGIVVIGLLPILTGEVDSKLVTI